MKMMIPLEGEIKNLSRVWLIVTASLCYCRLISAKLPKGKWRFISLLPIFYIFTLLPLFTSSAFFTGVTAFFITWLSNFKLLLFAFDRGPIAPDPDPKPLPTFIAMAALPFDINRTPTPNKSKKLPLFLATEISISVVLFSILHDYKQRIHPQIVLILYCCLVFLLIEILVELSSLVAWALLGLDLESPSDEPYLSTSLREFWGRRWNRTVNSILRQTVYRPVRSATEAAMGGDAAAVAGVMAAFVVSGLMHELLVWYITRAPPSWEMTMFFVVHGVCVAVEFGMAERKWRLPWFVAAPLTVGFVVGTSSWLFFPPLMRNGADTRVIEEVGFVLEVVKGVWNSSSISSAHQ
ncbi:hypothetical protein ACS0TY_032629 [Phlomoides rotata]